MLSHELYLHRHLMGLAPAVSTLCSETPEQPEGGSLQRLTLTKPLRSGLCSRDKQTQLHQTRSERRKRKRQISGRKWAGSLTLQPMAWGRWEMLQTSKANSRETLSGTTRELALLQRHCQDTDGGQCPRSHHHPSRSPFSPTFCQFTENFALVHERLTGSGH